MIFETNISDYYKVVQSGDECCYKYILGKLEEASEIFIMAYGETKRNKELFNSLENLKGNITLITDLECSSKVKKINQLHNSFNLDRNSKVIMTEKAVFIGAEQGDFSTGFLTIDSDVIEELKANLFTNKEEGNDQYIGFEFTKVQLIFMNYYSKINRIIEDIIKNAFKEDEKGNGYYNSKDAQISIDDLEWIKKTIDEFNETIEAVKEAELKKALIDTFNKDNLIKLQSICTKNEYMMKLAALGNEQNEMRKELATKAEKEIVELYDKLSIFNEELYGVVEQMIDIKTNQ